VCIEIDATLPLIHQFEIETPLSVEPILIQVEYEWKPLRCGKCCLFGHVLIFSFNLGHNGAQLGLQSPPKIAT